MLSAIPGSKMRSWTSLAGAAESPQTHRATSGHCEERSDATIQW